MPVGTVKFFNDNKGYGFIQPDGGGNDAFVHITAVERSGMHTLRENQRVSYDLQQDNRGKMSATNLKAVDDSAQPAASAANDEAGQAEEAEQPEEAVQPEAIASDEEAAQPEASAEDDGAARAE